MNIKSILFPTDFSESSDAALNFASSLAAESGALLYFAHVSDSTPVYYAGYGAFAYEPGRVEEIIRNNHDRLEKTKPTVEGVDCQHHSLTGDAAKEILAFAKKESVDLVVMGSHGRTGLSRLLMGSVAEEVVRRAACPVLIVKQPTEKVDAAPAVQTSEA